ncbi:hypothetical protein SAY86_029300 [Trapa natans]|uniref:Uncharacterized protein n=1 Tax=Trapa natans TaxID=22666 RepID=A0AAN7M1Y6_TRANT|nr:hypothetical protein SAY86_029300 [Trapa natans]
MGTIVFLLSTILFTSSRHHLPSSKVSEKTGMEEQVGKPIIVSENSELCSDHMIIKDIAKIIPARMDTFKGFPVWTNEGVPISRSSRLPASAGTFGVFTGSLVSHQPPVDAQQQHSCGRVEWSWPLS